jgi:pimeloyl-ACP methyl ester carboxylesterase
MDAEILKRPGTFALVLGASSLAACAPPDPPDAGVTAAGVGTALSTDGVPIVYEVFGEARAEADAGAPTLVLIHGWSCDRSYWAAQVEPFAARYRVVTLDLAGNGDSGLDRENWTIASYGADVTAVVEELDLENVILVGHSMGGDVAVDATRLMPDRVAAMVWVDTYSQLGTPRTPESIQEFVAPLRADFVANTYALVREGLFRPDSDSALVERVARDMSAAPADVAVRSLESSFANSAVVPVVLEEELDLPVVAINPDDGSTDVESLARYGVEVVLVPNAGHFMMMEDPERFNAILMDVIDGLGASEEDEG